MISRLCIIFWQYTIYLWYAKFNIISNFRIILSFRSLGGKLRIGLAEQSVLMALGHAMVLTPPCQEYPPPILDAGKDMNSEKLKKHMDEAALVIKTAYW